MTDIKIALEYRIKTIKTLREDMGEAAFIGSHWFDRLDEIESLYEVFFGAV